VGKTYHMTSLSSGPPDLFWTTKRRLAAAVVASLALHTLIWHVLPPIRAQIAPLTRTLEVLLVTPPEEPPRALEPTPPARPEPVTRKPRAVRPAPQQPTEALEAPGESAPVALPEAAPPLTEPAPAIATRAPEPAPLAAVATPSPDLLAGYGNRVSSLLARHREYPRVALMRGWEGTVTLRLRVAPGGKLIEAKVEGSSGHPVLDTQALEMVKRVAALPAPPEGLREREFAVLVPVVFRLER
jgi:protein TonB